MIGRNVGEKRIAGTAPCLQIRSLKISDPQQRQKLGVKVHA